MRTHTKRVTIPLRPVDWARLDLVARRRDVPVAQVAREAVKELVKRELEASDPQPVA